VNSSISGGPTFPLGHEPSFIERVQRISIATNSRNIKSSIVDRSRRSPVNAAESGSTSVKIYASHFQFLRGQVDDAVFTTAKAWALKLCDNRNFGNFRNWKGS
jgi:hypothetical protein